MSGPFNFDYRFHPAGQGVFASGTVRESRNEAPDTPFQWVVDCGSTAPTEVLRPSVSRYRDLVLEPHHLDLLCISHFDKDHVSGLGDLLRDLHVDRIVMPYYTPIERLVLGTQQSPGDRDYIAFLSNPVAYVLERAASIREIVIIGGPPADGPIDPVYDDRPPQPPRDLLDEEPPPKNEGWRVGFPESPVAPLSDGFPLNEATRAFARRCGTILLNVPSSFQLIASPTTGSTGNWEFLFFHKPIDPAMIADLKVRISRAFDRGPNRAGAMGLAYHLLISSRRSQLKRIFASTLKNGDDINSTSLCVYSGPFSFTGPCLGGTSGPFPHSLIGGWGAHAWLEHFPIKCSIFYTGDADFSNHLNRQQVREFLADPRHGTPTTPRWNQIAILQVPHHGSRYNWESGVANEFGHCWSVFCADEYHRKYKHPHREVLLDLLHRGPLLTNKHEGWAWQGTVQFP